MNLTKPWGKLIEPFVRFTMKNHEFLFIFSVLMWSLPAGRTSSGTLETRYGGGEELSRSRYFCSLGDWVWVVLWESISQEGQVICVGWGMDDLVDWVFNGVSVSARVRSILGQCLVCTAYCCRPLRRVPLHDNVCWQALQHPGWVSQSIGQDWPRYSGLQKGLNIS